MSAIHRFRPKDSTEVVNDAADAVVYLYYHLDPEGVLDLAGAIAYSGRRTKPDWQQLFETEEERQEYIDRWFAKLARHRHKSVPTSNSPFRWRNVTEERFATTDNGGFVQQGDGYLIMGMGDDLETTPRPMPPEAELRKAAETPHNYPDLAQAPLREQFDSDGTFEKALVPWLVNVAPAVVRRNKRLERIQMKPGATAKDIVAAIRARAKASSEPPLQS